MEPIKPRKPKRSRASNALKPKDEALYRLDQSYASAPERRVEGATLQRCGGGYRVLRK